MDSYNNNPAFKTSAEEQALHQPAAVPDNDDPYVIQLSKPYLFEDRSYTEVDLTALRDASTTVLLKAERAWAAKGNVAAQIETNMAYCLEVAAVATDIPINFFERLPKKDGITVKRVVQQDFFGTME